MYRMTVVLAVLAGVLALLVPAALADQTYDDPAADSGGAPDVTSVEVTNDNVEHVVPHPLRPAGAADHRHGGSRFLIDLDRNSNTGGDNGGEERMIAYDAESDSYYYAGLNGRPSCAIRRPTPVLVQDAEVEISIPRPNLGTTQAFDFWLYAHKYVGDEVTAEDSAPDGLPSGPTTFETKAVQLRAQQPQGTPRFPVAGKRFVLVSHVRLP